MYDIIFLDMDGVLVNFMKGALTQFLGQKKAEEKLGQTQPESWHAPAGFELQLHLPHLTKEQIFDSIADNPRFWVDLEPMPWAFDLMELAQSQAKQVRILTAPVQHTNCHSQKAAWIEQYFPQLYKDRAVILAKEKYLLAAAGRMLIDDNEQQTTDFRASSGSSILFPAPYNINYKHSKNPLEYVERKLCH